MLQQTDDHTLAASWPSSAAAYERAVQHSRRVRRMKILLPIGALLITCTFIGVSVVRAYLPENIQIESAKIENGKVVMEKPAISGRNSEGISYSLRASRALQDIKNPNIIALENIAAAVPVNDKIIATVNALGGVFDRGADYLDLNQPFTLNLSSGIDAKFNSAKLDIKGGTLDTPDPVEINTKGASIVANSLQIKDKGRTMLFTGQVRLQIEPSTLQKNDSVETVQP